MVARLKILENKSIQDILDNEGILNFQASIAEQ